MSLIYNENEPKSSGRFDINKFNPNKMWLTHYKNSLFLTFMMINGDFTERVQATREMIICDRKMAFWKRDSRFDHKQMITDATKAKKEWTK